MRRGVFRGVYLPVAAATAMFGTVMAFPAVVAPAAPAEIVVPLGTYTFGNVTAPTATVARAGAGEIGYMEPGQGAQYGPMSFDVTPNGTVWVLDEVNDRVLGWEPARTGQRLYVVAIDVDATGAR